MNFHVGKSNDYKYWIAILLKFIMTCSEYFVYTEIYLGIRIEVITLTCTYEYVLFGKIINL